jgi:hypothetical protein
MTNQVELDSLLVVFPVGDYGTKREVKRYVSRHYGIPQSRITVCRIEEWQIGTWEAAYNWVPLERWFPALAEGWTPYVVVRGLDLVA